jgi:hypothetical protein
MPSTTESLIQTGLDHLGRFAFYTRDNPFVSSRAGLDLRDERREELVALLDGEVKPTAWLDSSSASALLKTIKIGSVPRDVRLLVRGGELVPGIESVHAFVQAHLFWWLVSILWSISIAEAVDPLLGDSIKGFRFHFAFLEDPATSGVMFRDQAQAHERWEKFPSRVAAEHPGEILATNTLDIRAFYYSVDATPSKILSNFFDSKGENAPGARRLRVLTALLSAVHARFAELCAEVQPRRADLGEEGRLPLPVGFPSSQVLANMVMSMALGDIEARPETVAAAAYADDLIVMTKSLPDLDEKPADYFARLGLAEAEEPYALSAPTIEGIARLRVRLDKSGFSYSRHVESEAEDGEEAEQREEAIGNPDDSWDPYIESDTSPDWGARLRTVLRAPHKRDRVPRELRNEILALLDEVRVGLSPEEARERFDPLIGELDHGLFLALRPYWCELLVIGLTAQGPEIVGELSELVRRVTNALVYPDGATGAGKKALRWGLRSSWVQALAQALAVASDKAEREQLLEEMPELDLGQAQPAKMTTIVGYAMRIRRRRLIPNLLVAAPLSEFTDWEGRLIGHDAFSRFLDWYREAYPEGAGEELAEQVEQAVRFIRLHEVCLAVHLWAGDPDQAWIEQAFAVLAAQPLIHEDLVGDLRGRAEAVLAPESGEEEQKGSKPLRVALPSIRVREDQLEAALGEDLQRRGEIAKGSRAALQKVVLAGAEDRVRFMVLPEWSIIAQQLPWLMEQASRNQMLTVGGQAPEIVAGSYRNRLWTGIPLTDQAGHRACLVPPPRQKLFLSPEESALIRKADVGEAPSSRDVAVYAWRGMRVASLLCFEFADIGIRKQLRFESDVITVSSWNRDWHYFEVVQDATTRDNYCLTVCVNTGALPGTRIVRPTRSEKAVAASVHGSDVPVSITKMIDMRPILAAQRTQAEPAQVLEEEPSDDVALEDYKPFPPV